MSQKTHTPERIPREQLEIALELLEAQHGGALKRGAEREATALYYAIGTVEDALEESYEPEHPPQDAEFHTDVERSREARAQGYRASTLLGTQDSGRIRSVLKRVFGDG